MPDDPTQALDLAVSRMAAASSEALRAVADTDVNGLWKGSGFTSMSGWLAARYGLAFGTAREWVRVARALRRLPSIGEAYAHGRLSWDQIRPLTRFVTAETDAEWAVRAETWRPWSLHREAERHRKVSERQVADVRRIRSAALWWDSEQPLMYLEARLPAEEGARVQTALERRAEEVVLADDPDEPAEARMADALVELVAGNAPADVMVVHVDERALRGQNRAPALAETERGVRITGATARRLACSATVEWVLERDGRPVGVGRASRQLTPRLLRLLRHRDGACRFPGCERRSWLKAHHLVHWSRGGPTDLDNLVLLCHAHHRLVHEGRWRTSGNASTLRFHDPGGRVLGAPLPSAPDLSGVPRAA